MVTNYTIENCKYIRSKLKDVLYLISAEHVKNVHVDNNEVYVDGLTELPLRINGFNIQFNEQTSLDERYKFQKTLTLSMHGYVSYKIFGGRYYAIIEDIEGVFYMVNVDFPSRITHTFNLSKNTNQTDFTFSSLSNFPTLKLNAEFEAVEPVCLGLNIYGIDSLQLLEKDKAKLDTVNKSVITTEPFKTVEFLGDSCTFQEIYDGFKVTDTISFVIPLNKKLQWGWHLLEFIENKYSAIITPKSHSNKYFSGFNFGLEPSYTIQTASNQGDSDIITITLTETSSYGTTSEKDWSEEQQTETRWRWVKKVDEIICYECIGYHTARYLVKQEVDYFGYPTGNYQVMEGYESQYPVFHIVDTFTEQEIFETNDCGGGDSCDIETTIPSSIVFTSTTCNTYTLQTSCDWSINNIPLHLTVTPTSGVANSAYTVTICNTQSPSGTVTENNLQLQCCNSVRIINVKVGEDSTCLKPTTKYINCLAQNVQFTYNGNCMLQITSIDPKLTYSVGYNTLTVNVPRNYESSAITWSITYTNCNCSLSSETVSIIQDKTYDKWVEESGYICESGNSYSVERRYTGTTSGNISTRTDEIRKGQLIQSGDTRCSSYQTKWEWNGDYTCINGDKYKVENEWISYDGSNWTKTGITRLGELAETSSEWCNSAVTYSWVLTDRWVCDRIFDGKWLAIYDNGSVSSAECDSTSAITRNEIASSGLSSVIIGDCVTRLGNGAFVHCYSLPSIVIPDSVTSIGEGVFLECSGLTSCTIGSGVTSIGQWAFQSCRSLTSINIPSGVTSIDNYTFAGCRSLPSIVIPDSVTSIGYNAFGNCSDLTSITIPDSVTSIDDAVFRGCSGLTSCTIGSGVTSIGVGAFEDCSGLPSIVIPDSVTTIGQGAFEDCSGLTSVTIGSGVTTIGGGAFGFCSGLTSINIPSGVTSIDNYTFQLCYSLPSIVIPDSVTSIGDWAFTQCSGLTSCAIGSGVTSIGQGAFFGCSGLTSIDIPDSVTSIGGTAFTYCGGLTSVVIPSGVTSIGDRAFYYCSGLTSITVNATTPPTLGSGSFGNTNNCPIYVPAESVNTYKSASGWSTYANRITAII